MEDKNAREYINYLERRLEKLSQNNSVGERDLNQLIDTRDEMIASNSLNFKESLTKCYELERQVDFLLRKTAVSDEFVKFLEQSIWWRITRPLRVVNRFLRNRQSYEKFEFSSDFSVKKRCVVVIHHRDGDKLEKQIKSVYKQEGIADLEVCVLDFGGSKQTSKICKDSGCRYVNSFLLPDDCLVQSKLLYGDADWLITLGQGIVLNDARCLANMIQPIATGYARTSYLFDERNSQVREVQNKTFFNELKIRFVDNGEFRCLLLPNNRDKIHYIPLSMVSDAVVIARSLGE